MIKLAIISLYFPKGALNIVLYDTILWHLMVFASY